MVDEASNGAREKAIREFFEEHPGEAAVDSPLGLASNFSALLQDLPSADTKPLGDVQGSYLAERLKAIQPGKAGASEYEKTCSDIIDYLFGDFLLDARPQSRLEDDLSILDVVYRVKPGDMFWDTLTRDFRARLIAFECKNYTDKITPAQVHSTERYVNTSALRPICIMVSRKGANEHAESTAFGAMREGGKLFVFLSDSDLEQMLSVRDAQIRKQSREEQSTGTDRLLC
ncbi:hypothetical protein NKJ84_16035 [Mesorhizobium sp. M0048]|uniref:hypothetical protein n=1 Tax=Mesorhizobium sp. M0048 TaxID=2956860 RepID=UPI00333B29B7